MQHMIKCCSCPFSFNNSQHIQHNDVAGTFPHHIHNGIAQQTWIYPVFDIAVATAHLQRFQRHVFATLGNVVLAERRQNAQQAAILLYSMTIYTFQHCCRLKSQGGTTLNLNQQVNQLAAHQWVLCQRASKGDTTTSMDQCFEIAAAHGGKRTDCCPDTSEIDHLGHLHKTTLSIPNQVGLCSLQ